MPDRSLIEHDAPPLDDLNPPLPPEPDHSDGPRRWGRAFGPLTGRRIVALLVAIAFLGGAVGYFAGSRSDQPLSTVDVGFMQDMSYHHAQAVEMAQSLLFKSGIDADVRNYAMEILLEQRYEIGLMNATLDRFGHASTPGAEAMGWMGPPVPVAEMPGLATRAQLVALNRAAGRNAEALFIALMSKHHLGGMHMADDAYRHGHDRTTRNLALSMVKVERDEIVEMNSSRIRLGLPIPAGFTDPTRSPDLHPLSLSGD